MEINSEEHIKGGGKIRSFLLGFNDGLISTFTLLVGVAAATLSSEGNTIIILTGIAAMVSGAISMGLGEYISSRSEVKYIRNELKREKTEIELFPKEEEEEVREILQTWGFEGELLDMGAKKIISNKDIWVDFLFKGELGLEEPENPLIGGSLTFIAFVLGAFTTLFPYFFKLGMICLILSSVISFSMLFIVGMMKTKITGENTLRSGIEMVLVGIIAFLVSFSVGLWLEQIIPSL
ncbi:MAG: VIT1/CCC1 transporter family protein [Candidatus Lokiarchaeota archaeon]|nr:VIT1/CCC1 transporter family protein [Candidatus Lokiarchaeota archaeon]